MTTKVIGYNLLLGAHVSSHYVFVRHHLKILPVTQSILYMFPLTYEVLLGNADYYKSTPGLMFQEILLVSCIADQGVPYSNRIWLW